MFTSKLILLALYILLFNGLSNFTYWYIYLWIWSIIVIILWIRFTCIDKNYYVQCFHLSLFQENLINMQYAFVTKQYKIFFVFCRMGLCLELIHELQRTLLWQTKTAAKFTTFLIIYSEWNGFECIITCSILNRKIYLPFDKI